MGPAAYPPTPNAATGFVFCVIRARGHRAFAGASIAIFLDQLLGAAFALQGRRRARRFPSGQAPACGTSFISNPRVQFPTSTNVPFRFLFGKPISRANCQRGKKTCPPVPPPAIKSFTVDAIPRAGGSGMLRPLQTEIPQAVALVSSRFRRPLRNIQQNASSQQHEPANSIRHS